MATIGKIIWNNWKKFDFF